MPALSRAFFAAFDRGTVNVAWRGARVSLKTGQGLFCADRLDEGTRLLLDHLPASIGGRVLDVGCGYGALCLPIAAMEHGAHVLAVDRDLVAVRYASRNADALGLANVEVRASLGYDAIDERDFDLVLSNVPARIGPRGLAHFIAGGLRRLAPSGELRIVAIRDLVAGIESIARERAWSCTRITDGPRHSILAFTHGEADGSEDPSLYARDELTIAGVSFARPHDASEDPGHAREGAPLLAELLPRAPKEALVWRSAHGVMSVLLALRGARVVHGDRDLLALAFARSNAANHGVKLEAREAAWFPELEASGVPLIVAELSSTAGERVAAAELDAVRRALAPGGQALVLSPARLARGLGAPVLASRGAWLVLRVTAAR